MPALAPTPDLYNATAQDPLVCGRATKYFAATGGVIRCRGALDRHNAPTTWIQFNYIAESE
jgi:hypothetical protein